MDDALDENGSDDDISEPTEEDGHLGPDALELAASTTLVEVTPGVAVVFGEVPDGLELISLDLRPSFDRAQLSTAMGSLGNAGTIVGNVAETVSSAQGLFRVNDATLSLRDIHWMFPDGAAHEDIDSLATVLSEATPHAFPGPTAIEQSAAPAPTVDS